MNLTKWSGISIAFFVIFNLYNPTHFIYYIYIYLLQYWYTGSPCYKNLTYQVSLWRMLSMDSTLKHVRLMLVRKYENESKANIRMKKRQSLLHNVDILTWQWMPENSASNEIKDLKELRIQWKKSMNLESANIQEEWWKLIMKKEGLVNLTLTRHIKGNRSRRKQQVYIILHFSTTSIDIIYV